MARTRPIATLVIATLLASSFVVAQPVESATAVETRMSVADKLAEELAAAGVDADAAWAPPADAAGKTEEASDLPDTHWQTPDDTREVAAPEDSATSRAPASVVIGPPGLGALPYFSFEEIPLSDDTVVRINVANGNMLITSADQSIASPGIGLRSDRYYNGLSAQDGDFGGGWTSSLSGTYSGLDGATATTDAPNADQVFQGPSGIRVKFTWTGTEYTADAGFKGTLTTTGTVPDNTTDAYYTLKYNSNGEELKFNRLGYLLSDTDSNGVGVSYTYPTGLDEPVATDSAGRQITVTSDGESTSYITAIQDSAGRQTQYERNAADMLSKVTQPDGGVTSYTYDNLGRLSTITLGSYATDPKVTFTYNALHKVVRVTQTTKVDGVAGADAVTSFAYYGPGTPTARTQVTDARGNASTFAIDSSGRVTKATNQLGQARSQTWSASSDVITTTDAFAGATPGNITTLSYDTLGNQTGATLPTGAASSAIYQAGPECTTDDPGNPYLPKCSTDSAGNKKQFTYDAAGNTTKVVDTTAGGTGVVLNTYTYDNEDRTVCGGFAGQVCMSTDGNNNATSFEYDTNGDLIAVTPPAPMGSTTYTYDSLGRALTVTDGNGDTTTYTYDEADRLISSVAADGREWNAYYTDLGLATATCDDNLACDFNRYDSQGRTTLTNHFGTTSSGDYVNRYVYDAIGNMVETTTAAGTTNYVFDAANNLVRVQQPGGSCEASGVPAANSRCVTFAYDANGAETVRTFPAGAQQTTIRDASGRPTRITAVSAMGNTVVDIGYSFQTASGADRTDLQTRTSHVEQGITADAITSYTYDSTARLTSAIEKVGNATTASWSYTFDAAGNRITQVRAGATGAPAGTITYAYNGNNQLTTTSADTTTWAYDAAGNQTRNGITGITAVYGRQGQTASIGDEAMSYFGPGNVTRTTAGSRSLTSSALGLATQTTTATYGYNHATDGSVIGFRGNSGHFYITDHLGSVVGMFGDTGAYEGGYSYSPYGEARFTGSATAVTANTQRYIGGYQEATNIYKLGARYYDATIGRFTQMDPSGQESHPYSYTAGNPVGYSDPTGLSAVAAFRLIGGLNGLIGAYQALTGANLAGYTAGFIVSAACGGAVAVAGAASFGVGLVLGLFCETIGQITTLAIDSAIDYYS